MVWSNDFCFSICTRQTSYSQVNKLFFNFYHKLSVSTYRCDDDDDVDGGDEVVVVHVYPEPDSEPGKMILHFVVIAEI